MESRRDRGEEAPFSGIDAIIFFTKKRQITKIVESF